MCVRAFWWQVNAFATFCCRLEFSFGSGVVRPPVRSFILSLCGLVTKRKINETLKRRRNIETESISSTLLQNLAISEPIQLALEARSLKQGKVRLIKNNTMKLLRLNFIFYFYLLYLPAKRMPTSAPFDCMRKDTAFGKRYLNRLDAPFISLECIWIFVFYQWKNC